MCGRSDLKESMNMTNFRTKAEYCEHQFFAANKELLAHYDLNQVQESLIAYLQLNETAETLRAAATKPNEYRKDLGMG